MKKFILIFVIALFAFSVAKAHEYQTGIGVRGGGYNGLTVKHFVSNKHALEGLLYTRWRGFEVTGLYEIHEPAFDVPHLYWYYGFGGHVGFYDGDETHERWGARGNQYTVIGADGIIGLEYNIQEIPFNVSLDWKPAIDLIGTTNSRLQNGGLSVRYVF